MSTLETPVGQQAVNFADACHRTVMADGRNVLEVLHKEGFMKKVPTSQVIMTPTAQSKIRLDELNNLLAEMGKGADAVKKMAEIDAQSGLQKRDNTKKAREVGEPVSAANPAPLAAPVDGVLTDEAIANQQLQQATRMRSEAKSLLAEADRLESDAAKLAGTAAVAVKKGPGRPKKNDTANSKKAA